jgi:hypothetical protein
MMQASRISTTAQEAFEAAQVWPERDDTLYAQASARPGARPTRSAWPARGVA